MVSLVRLVGSRGRGRFGIVQFIKLGTLIADLEMLEIGWQRSDVRINSVFVLFLRASWQTQVWVVKISR